MKKLTLLLLLISFFSFGQANKFFLRGKTRVSEPIPFWLGNGAIPASTNYVVYDPLTATSLAESYVNLANPGTGNATAGGGTVTQTQGEGWYFGGSPNYLIAGHQFSATGTLVVWVEESYGVNILGSPRVRLRPLNGNNATLQTNGSIDLEGVGSSAIYGISSGLEPFRNGRKHTVALPAVIHANLNLYMGCMNSDGTPVNFAVGRILRWAYYDIVLSDAQQLAVFNSMRDYNLPAIDDYSNDILALNPSCYYPLNQSVGGFALDESGNRANSVIKYTSANRPIMGVPGLLGNCMQGNMDNDNTLQASDNFNTLTGLDLDSFSWSALIKNNNSDAQTRVLSITDVEYVAIEIRLGLLQLYFKENGVTSSYFSIAVPNNTWFHLVMTNDEANNEVCVYVNGVKSQATKTTGPFTLPIPTTYPRHMFACTGYIQHIAFFNYILNQSQVDSINPIP